jgi:IclR family acetate operon transcriptional repressor
MTSDDGDEDAIPTFSAEAEHRGVATKLFTLLEAVAAAPDGISVREVARDTGIDKSSVSRIFNQLAALDVVEQSPLTGRFEVGRRLSSLGEVLHTHNSLWGLAEPIVRELVARFDETCYFIVREGNQARFQERIDCRQAIRYVIEPGVVSPLYAGAAGRAILSGMPVDEATAYLNRVEVNSMTTETVTDRELLQKFVEQDRERGYSVSLGERVAGGRGIGAPVLRADGYCVAAILWTCPSTRFDLTRIDEFGTAVREAALRLSHLLGYSVDAA